MPYFMYIDENNENNGQAIHLQSNLLFSAHSLGFTAVPAHHGVMHEVYIAARGEKGGRYGMCGVSHAAWRTGVWLQGGSLDYLIHFFMQISVMLHVQLSCMII